MSDQELPIDPADLTEGFYRMFTDAEYALARVRAQAALVSGEVRRVQAIVARDRADNQAEAFRQECEKVLLAGGDMNPAKLTVGPTREWLTQGETTPFNVDVPKGTSYVVRSVRRRSDTTVDALHRSGRLTDDNYRACCWYAQRHEAAGLDGRYKTSHLSLAGNVGGSGGMAQAPMAQHLYEMQARLEFRAAREEMPARYLRFFDAIVISDVPLRRAVRFARCRTSSGGGIFADCCGALAAFLDRSGFDLRELSAGD